MGYEKKPKKPKILEVGNIVYMIPVNDPWSGMLEAALEFSEDYLEQREQPKVENRESLNP